MITLPHRYAEKRIIMQAAGTTRTRYGQREPSQSSESDMNDHIGARIRYWRRRRGLTQTVLAGLAGLSQPFISYVEAGRKSIERRSTLVAVAHALQVTVADLLGQPDDPTDPLKGQVERAIPALRVAL